MNHSWRWIGVLSFGLALAGSVTGQSLTAQEFARLLERAGELNTTAPWQESQAILDRIEDHLDLATPDQYARFAYLEARNLALQGQAEQALGRLEAALDRTMSPQQRLAVLRLASNVALVNRRFAMSFEMLNQALALIEQEALVNDDGVYGLAAYALTQVGEYQLALNYAERAIERTRSFGTLRDQCWAEQRVAFLHKSMDNIEASERYYRLAIEHCGQVGDRLIEGTAKAGLADLLRLDGRLDQAGTIFDEAIRDLSDAEYASGLAEARLYRARLAEARGDTAAVRTLVKSAIGQFRAENNWEYLAECHQLLARSLRAEGDLAGALDQYERYMTAWERFLNTERSRRLAYLEVEFDLQHTEQQLELAREHTRVAELELQASRQRSRLTITGYALGFVVVAILAYLLVQAKRERRRFQSLSQRDGLTALSNHTRFFELAEQAFRLACQKNLAFTLILADIDHFKRVNDVHGHLIGDDVLRRVGARIREHFSSLGIIGRIGGEEFAIAVPGRKWSEIQEPLEALRKALRQVRADDAPVPVTMSFGIAERRARDSSLTVMRERADQALYEAKRAGRDEVVLAGAPGSMAHSD